MLFDSLVSSPPSVPLKVLVVDDDPATVDALVLAVAQLGYTPTGARGGPEALAALMRERPDVVVCDWQMPELDGIELLRRVRAGDDGGYTYFILMTSYADKAHFVAGMEAGADDYQTKPVELDELGARLVSAARVVSLHRKLSAKAELLRRDSQRSYQIARVDPLTQVGNRLAMDEDLRALFVQVKRYNQRVAVAMADIDHFKAYNDQFGHLGGDTVLQRVAQRMRDELRQSDAVYRYGGEEFVVVLREQSVSVGANAADRVRVAVERMGIPAPGGGVVTVSFGVSAIDVAHDRSADDALRRADAALYQAKLGGRNRVVIAKDAS